MNLTVGHVLREQKQPILITGNTGFKGTWLGILLNMLDIPFVGLALPTADESLFTLIGKDFTDTQFFFDINDRNKVRKLVEEIKPSAVIHLAAQPLVLESYREPIGTFSTNVMGTAHLLDALTFCEFTKATLVVTTDKVYRNDNLGEKFSESHALGGADPYSASKVGTELAVDAWRAVASLRNKMPIATARAGNVIGGGDFAKDRLLPDLIRSFSENSAPILRSPYSTRPWQHVLDPLIGYLAYLEYLLKGNYERALNFSPDGRSLSVEEVYTLSSSSWGTQLGYKKIDSRDQGGESTLLELDSSRAKKILGWDNLWSQEEAVISTVEWWKNCNLRGMSHLDACLDDLRKVTDSKYF